MAPTLTLENLPKMADVTPDLGLSTAAVAVPATSGLLGVVALAAWRLAPMVLSARRRQQRHALVRRNLWIVGGLGLAALAFGAWKAQSRA